MKKLIILLVLTWSLAINGITAYGSDDEVEYNDSVTEFFYLLPSEGTMVQRHGRTYVVNFEDSTIFSGGEWHGFEVDGNVIAITFPDGAIWEDISSNYTISGNWLVDAEVERHFEGIDLANAVREASSSTSARSRTSNVDLGTILIGIGLFALGIWTTKDPEAMWQRTRGWQFRNVEPSDMAITLTAIGGGSEILIGIGMVIAGLFGLGL